MSESVDIAALRALLSDVERPWEYRPYEHDDWGFIRGPERESLIGKVKPVVALSREGDVGPDNHDHHRRMKTDPYEPVGRLIVEAVNAVPSLLYQIEALQAENAKMREALDPFAELGAVWSKADETDNSCWATMDPATRLVVGGGDIGWNAVTVGQLRAAHDALTPTKDHPHAAS